MGGSGLGPQKQWWRLSNADELRQAAFGFAESLWDSAAERERRNRFLTYASQYYGRPISSLSDFDAGVASFSESSANNLVANTRDNLTRTLADTAMSRFAKAETRVQFMTSGGTPAQQSRSETATDAANALLEQTESEQALRRAALHACVFDLGAVKSIDHDDGPTVEHVPAWEFMFDPADAHRGKPSILVQRFPADRDALIAQFCDPGDDADEDEIARLTEIAEAILDSGSGGLISPDHTPTDQHCIVYELWRLPVGKKPGRHVVVTDHALVFDEKWTPKKFPVAFFGWSAPLRGAYPESIAAIVSAAQFEIDGIDNRISQCLRQLAIPRVIRTGPDAALAQVRMGNDAIGDYVDVPVGCTVQFVTGTQIMSPELQGRLDAKWGRGFEMTGISQSSAIGSRPAGLNSAPAQREWNEINQDRLSLVALDYQQAHVDLASLLLDSVARIPDYEISIKSTNGRWLRTVKASELNLDSSDYVIQKFPIGALPTTPTGKLASAADLLQAGAIDKEQFDAIVQLPDLKYQMNLNLQSRRATEKLIAKMLETGRYEAPPKFLEPKYAAQYAQAKYLEGISSDPEMPAEQLALLVNWLAEMESRQPPPTPAPVAAQGPTSIDPLTPAPLAPNPTEQFSGAMAA